MEYGSIGVVENEILQRSNTHNTSFTAPQLPVWSLAIMLMSAFKTRLFHPCKKLDLPKRLIPL